MCVFTFTSLLLTPKFWMHFFWRGGGVFLLGNVWGFFLFLSEFVHPPLLSCLPLRKMNNDTGKRPRPQDIPLFFSLCHPVSHFSIRHRPSPYCASTLMKVYYPYPPSKSQQLFFFSILLFFLFSFFCQCQPSISDLPVLVLRCRQVACNLLHDNAIETEESQRCTVWTL